MNIKTNLADTVEKVTDQERYDTSIKEIFADKQVLSRILKYTLTEFSTMSFEEIIDAISNVEIGKTAVDPGFTNLGKIEKMSEEDNVPGEGKIIYDIRFVAYIGAEKIKVLLNIEAQKAADYKKLGYHLDNRIIYYLSRMISAQKNVEFLNSDYDNIKAVRSIWICMDAAEDEDSINRISFEEETLFGSAIEFENVGKMQAVVIRLRADDNAVKSKNNLIAMLEELIRKESAENKKKNLEAEYQLIMNTELERRVNTMCNLSEVMINKGIEQGLEKQKADTIRRMLIKNYPEGDIVELTDCTQEELDKIKNELISK